MKTLLLAVLALASVSAFAKNCDNVESNYDMKICASENLEEQDKRLNEVYAKLMNKLDKGEQKKLKIAQRAWITYRDANCDFAAGEMRGGTGEGLIYVSCLGSMTSDRADELQDSVDFR